MVSPSASLGARLPVVVVALLAVAGMHLLGTTAHLCHVGLGIHADGGGHDDGRGHREATGPTCCMAVGCIAIALSAAGMGAAYARRSRSVWPALAAAISSLTTGPEPPVPRALLSI
jgi:hypothetical protein